jgi:hypothetical protein
MRTILKIFNRFWRINYVKVDINNYFGQFVIHSVGFSKSLPRKRETLDRMGHNIRLCVHGNCPVKPVELFRSYLIVLRMCTIGHSMKKINLST